MIVNLWKSLTLNTLGNARKWRTLPQPSCWFLCSRTENKFTRFLPCNKFANTARKKLQVCGMKFAALATLTTITLTSLKSFGISNTICSRRARDTQNNSVSRNVQFLAFRDSFFDFFRKNTNKIVRITKVFCKNLLEFINIYDIIK